MNSALLGILVAALAWLFMRFMRARTLRRAQPRDRVPADTPRTMPRIGVQGSVTKDQLRRLKALDFQPSRMWSKEEADLILDATVYLRAAILQVTGDRDPPHEIQNQILAFILSDDQLREYMRDWGRDQRSKGSDEEPGTLDRNEQFERVAAFLAGKFQERKTQAPS